MRTALRLALAAAMIALLAHSLDDAQAQSTDPVIRSLYGAVFIFRNAPGPPFDSEFGVTNEELHISKEGLVTAINRYITIGPEDRRRGYVAGQADAWATGQLTGRQFQLQHLKNPTVVITLDVASNGLTIKRRDGAIYTKQ
jgi:hypothetical protein